ncbi:MAG: pseudaminic acid synthase [Candidatus Magasanikbacteria bacterium CG10_big_fil_rev_8_21_14_0_10_47_10]|uniref:Pseudaminic acid synthase n=1 Tax=Candidatus Magasanikbacteria bacterium CG10_big_fil_rev_8_21_14_0_10_47_10 TaxID=1974652 RepID=A0A2H0TPU4_9BACT|nr:MAG: pseudaminic acid synthase [Candidatus Magasanikbacteria bacterium CG10_big_fil_rev_8_21_14_0_10_47_10]
MQTFTINTPKGKREIGGNNPCFIIAEMSANHGGVYEKAVDIVKAAAAAGADAIKLQTYTADGMTIDSRKEYFQVGGGGNPDSWTGETLYSIYQKAYTPREWHAPLQKIAEELDLVFFSTPFDSTAVDFLETLDVPLYKVASYEVTDIPLLKRIAQTGKPVIMSTGFASEQEIKLAVDTLRQHGASDIGIFHCVTAYSGDPQPEDTNMATMLDIAKQFDVVVGFSDNNAGSEIPLQAAIMGASMIEKHVVADSDDKTFDANFSVGPAEFTQFVRDVRRAEKIKGKVNYGIQSKPEEHNIRYRKSIFVTRDIKKGDIFTPDTIRVIRPNFGLQPRYYEEVLGKAAAEDIESGTPLAWRQIIGMEGRSDL